MENDFLKQVESISSGISGEIFQHTGLNAIHRQNML